MARDKKYYQISTLQRGIQVLELLIKRKSLTVAGLGRELDLNRSTSHRFLATLEEMGYVGKTKNKKYFPTFKILQVGMQVANNVSLRKIAHPFLQKIAPKHQGNVNLAYWDGHQIIHLDKIESREILRIDPSIGYPAAGHCTALGKAILAYFPEEDLNAYFRVNKLKRFTNNTITSRRQLDKELGLTRERGYALDNQELSIGLRCVACPAFDYTGNVCCSISVASLAINMPDDRIDQIQHNIKEVCLDLSRELGAPDAVLSELSGKIVDTQSLNQVYAST